MKNKTAIEGLARKLTLVGDESRLKILCVIFDQKKICVSDVAKQLNMSVATVSHHLLALARDGVLVSAKEGKQVCYMLKDSDFNADLKRFICRHRAR